MCDAVIVFLFQALTVLPQDWKKRVEATWFIQKNCVFSQAGLFLIHVGLRLAGEFNNL